MDCNFFRKAFSLIFMALSNILTHEIFYRLSCQENPDFLQDQSTVKHNNNICNKLKKLREAVKKGVFYGQADHKG